MASYKDLMSALRKADAAGDEAGARRLAQMAAQARSAEIQTPDAPQVASSQGAPQIPQEPETPVGMGVSLADLMRPSSVSVPFGAGGGTGAVDHSQEARRSAERAAGRPTATVAPFPAPQRHAAPVADQPPGQAILDALNGKGIGWQQYQDATNVTGIPPQRPVAPEASPFDGESLADLAKRRGQEFMQGLGGIFASSVEGIGAMHGRAMSGPRARENAQDFADKRAVTIADLRRKLMDPNTPQDQKAFLQGNLTDLLQGQERLTGIAQGDPSAIMDPGFAQKGKTITDAFTETFGKPPNDPSFWSKFAQGAGSMAGFLATTLAGGAIAGPAGAIGATTVAGSTSNAGQIFNEAMQAGASQEDALTAAGWAALVGSTEAIPIGRALKILPSGLRDKISGTVLRRIGEIGLSAGEEAAQEGGVQIMNNLIAQGYYDKERGWSEGVGEAALIGAILGGGIGAAGSFVQPRKPEDEPPEAQRNQPPAPNAGVSPLEGARRANVRTPATELDGRPFPISPESPRTPDPAPQPPAADVAPPVPAPAPAAAPETDDSGRYEIIPEIDTSGPEPVETGRMVRIDTETGRAEVVDSDAPAAAPEQETPESASTSPGAETGGAGVDVGSVPRPVDNAEAAPRKPGEPERRFMTHDDMMKVETDAGRFQYKDGGDESGVTDRLQGVKTFDPNRAGQAILYRTKDGRLIVADGHQRTGLAKRAAEAGQQDVGGMSAVIYDEKDGWTAQDVMVRAAVKNIGEGTGTAIDAARILRGRTETIEDLGLPPKSALVRDADGLRRLSDDAFGMVANGNGSERDGAIVGRVVSDKDLHADILALLGKLKPANAAQAEIIARDAAADSQTETQDSLFGSEQVAKSNYLERAKVLDGAVKQLRKEKSLFNTLLKNGGSIEAAGNTLDQGENARRATEDGTVLEYLQRQANMKGPISDALSAAAKSVKEGTPLGKARDQFVADVRGALQGGGEGRPGAGGGSQATGQLAPSGGQTPASEVKPEPAPAPEKDDFDAAGDDLFGGDMPDQPQKSMTDKQRAEMEAQKNQGKIRKLDGNTGDEGPLFDTQGELPAPAPEPAKKTDDDLTKEVLARVKAYTAKPSLGGVKNLPKSDVNALMADLDAASGFEARRKIADAWVLAQGKKKGVEFLVILDADGNLLAAGAGGKSGVTPPRYSLEMAYDGKVGYVTHNHPANRAFSPADMAIMVNGFKHFTAMGHKGAVYVAKRGPAYKALFKPRDPKGYSDHKEAFDVVMAIVTNRLQAMANDGTITVDKANDVFSHIFSLALHRHGVIDFEGSSADILKKEGFDADADKILKDTDVQISRTLGRAGFDVTAPRDRGRDQESGAGGKGAGKPASDGQGAPEVSSQDSPSGDGSGRVPGAEVTDDFDAAGDELFGAEKAPSESIESWQKARDQRIKASKAAGKTHLDQLSRSVEGMRGKAFHNVHDPKEKGTVRTVANTGDVVVNWADKYSADKNLVSEQTKDGKKMVWQSWLSPSDLKDYAVGKADPAGPTVDPVSPETFSSWKKSVPSSGTAGGWTVFDDTEVGKGWVLMNRDQRAGPFGSRADAVKWARANQVAKAAAKPASSATDAEAKAAKRINTVLKPKNQEDPTWYVSGRNAVSIDYTSDEADIEFSVEYSTTTFSGRVKKTDSKTKRFLLSNLKGDLSREAMEAVERFKAYYAALGDEAGGQTFPTTLEAIATGPKNAGRLTHIYAEYGGGRYYLASVPGQPGGPVGEWLKTFPQEGVRILTTDRADGTSINGDADGLSAAIEKDESAKLPIDTPPAAKPTKKADAAALNALFGKKPGGLEEPGPMVSTKTPAFKKWFGDSKVVGPDGEPLVVYHGTDADFEAFDPKADAKHVDLPGIFFTPDAGIADNFSASASRKEIRDADGYIEGYEGAQTVPVYLSIKNPAEIDGSEPDGGMARSSRIRRELEEAKAAGHDGAVIRGWRDGSGDVQYVAFDPTQIKSVYNRGTFDPKDPSILREDPDAFNDDTYQAAVPIFVRNVEGLNLDAMSDKEAYIAMARPLVAQGLTRDAYNEMRPYFERFLSEARAGKIDLTGDSDAPAPGGSVERDSGDAGTADDVGGSDVSSAAGRDGRGTGSGTGTSGQGDGQRTDGSGLPDSDAASVGGRGDTGVSGDGRPDGRRTDGDGDSADGGDRSQPGLRPDDAGTAATRNEAVDGPDRVGPKGPAKTTFRVADHASVAASVPNLHPEQVDDVVRIEKRFFKPDDGKKAGLGMLITNGTGTGKTMTALGTAKRFVDKGADTILALVKTQGEVDNWIKHGPLAGVQVDALRDTKDNGTGRGPVVVTTYANLVNNPTLAQRDWNLILADEAHMLMMNKAGNQTETLGAFRAVAAKPSHLVQRELMKRDEAMQKAKAIPDKTQSEKARAAVYAEARDAADAARKAGAPQAKALFLSATPWARDLNVDYGEGYLFDYPKDETRNGSNQSGRNWFMVENFGYRIRYHKLNKPEAAVDRGVFHREFHERLKREGALWGRKLDVAVDYDRRFVAVENEIGTKIDTALEYLRTKATEARAAHRKALTDNAAADTITKAGQASNQWDRLEKEVNRNFTYLKRMQLLEAMKAEAAMPDIKKHLAMGRKVVVFHDYIVGGGSSPFVSMDSDLRNGPLAQMERDLPWLSTLDFGHLSPPKDQVLEAFGDRAVEYNGTVPKGKRAVNKDRFNADGSGVDVMVVQADAGSGGISLHDTTGGHQRVLINVGMPTKPTTTLQAEGRTRRVGSVSNAPYRYYTIGTAWEREAFARRIAEQSGEVENLAMGNDARSIRQAFIDAYTEADAYPPSKDDGQGGRERDTVNNSASEFDIAKTHYYGSQKMKGRRDQRAGIDFFPTPEPLALKMVEWAGVRPYDKVLEPSAGDGSIARYFPGHADRTIVEPSVSLSSRAELLAPGSRVVNDTFENLSIVNKYDAVVMNPPFGSGGKTAMDHLMKAMQHTRTGGRVVALVPTGPAADKAFARMLDSGKIDMLEWRHAATVDLPSVTFERAGTSVNAVVMIFDRVGKDSPDLMAPPQNINMRGSDTIAGFFDRLEGIAGPARPERVGPSGVEADMDAADQAQAATTPTVSAPLSTDTGTYKLTTVTSKGGNEFPSVSYPGRVERDTFGSLLSVAKSHNGWWHKFSAKLGKGPTYAFRTTAARDAFLADIAKPVQGLEEPAYHGSPHTFDRFSLDAMGKGEGAQAFGWGMYFASRKGVAEYYRDNLSGRGIIGAKNVARPDGISDEKFEALKAKLETFWGMWDVKDIRPAIKKAADDLKGAREYLAHLEKVRADIKAENPDLYAEWYEGKPDKNLDSAKASVADAERAAAAQAVIDEYGLDAFIPKGRLYSVEVPDSSDLLDWDKPLSEQPEKIKAAIRSGAKTQIETAKGRRTLDTPKWEAVGVILDEPDLTGQELYESIGSILTAGSGKHVANKAASEWLRAFGIPGHRFLDGSSRGGTDGSHNYVIYDEDAVQIIAAEQRPRAGQTALDTDVLRAVMPGLRAEMDRLNLKRVNLGVDVSGRSRQGALAIDQLGQLDILIGQSLNPFATMYHESIHAMKAMNLFTVEEWTALERAARPWVEKHKIAERYPDLSPSEMIEEAIAEEFAERATARTPPTGSMIVQAFNKIGRFLRALKNAVTGAGFRTAEDVFGAALAGQIGARDADSAAMAKVIEQRNPALPRIQRGPRPTGPARPLPVHVPDRRMWDELTRSGASVFDRLGGAKGAASDMVDRARLVIQDRFLPVLRAQQAIERAIGRPLGDDHNAYQAETTYTGRAGRHLFEIDEQFTKPIIDLIQRTNGGLTAQNVGDWLAARHAKERNARIASINPQMPDGGSGITNAEADAYLNLMAASPHQAELQQIADLIDQLRERTLDLRLDAGLLSARDHSMWGAQYDHYVPLKGFDESDHSEATLDMTGIGRRYNIRGAESRMALGRQSAAFNPLVASLTQAKEVAIRAEKNRVGQAIYKLAKDHPSKALWTVKTPTQKRYYNRTTGLVETRVEPAATWKQEDNEFAVKVGGKEVRIVLHDERIIPSLSTMGGDRLDRFSQIVGMYTRFQSMVNTMLNPEFVVRNAFRDFTAAQINLPAMTDADSFGKAVAKNWRKAFMGAFRGMGGQEGTEWTDWYKEFEQSGAKISFWTLDNPVATADDISHRIHLARGNRAARFLKAATSPRALISTRDNKLLGFIERTNLAVDNAVRLASYVEARKRGWSKQKAANLAKNLTVNFNRRGTHGGLINAWFMFANAAIQGLQVFLSVMTSKRGAIIGAGGVMFGVMLELINAALSDEDDDGKLAYDKIPEWKLQRNMVFQISGKDEGGFDNAYSIPLPYTYSLFPYAGTQIGKVMRGVKKPEDAMKDFLVAVLSDVSPTGFGALQQTIYPTVIKDINEFADNENWLGRNIRPENPWADYGPNAYKYYGGVSEASKAATDYLNRITGGNAAESGLVDVSPEYLDHLAGKLTGGAGRFWGESADILAKAMTGEADMIESRNVPFASDMFVETGGWYDRNAFYENVDKIADAHKRAKLADQAGEKVPPRLVAMDRLYTDAMRARRDMTELNKQVQAIRGDARISDRAKIDRVKVIEQRQQKLYDQVNRRYLLTQRRLDEMGK